MPDRVGQQLGNYKLIALLGEGGFAEVYLGEHVFLQTQAAIKVLHTRLAQDDLDGFLAEARTIARLVHPQIVRVLEFGVEGSTPYLVMDYAPNGTLRARHPRGTQIALATILPYVKQVAEALHYAHEEKLVHRDVKPENMLVGRRSDILLSDFGIATVAQSSRYQGTQEVAGTVAYMAPEQVQGKPRPASDQYSLAVVVYEWLTGARPFHGSFTEIATQHVLTSPPPLHEKLPTVSPLVEQVVLTALAKDPKERFATMQAFATALEQAALRDQPTQIIRPSAPMAQPTTPPSSPFAPTIVLTPAHTPSTPPLPPTIRASLPPIHHATLGTTLCVYQGHSAGVTSLAWSPDGTRIASASNDHTVDVWEAVSGRHLLTYDEHTDELLAIAWSPDGARLASGSRDQTVQIWEAQRGGRLFTYEQHDHQVYTVAWSPNGKRLASGGFDETAQVWDAASGERLLTYEEHGECVNSVAWSPNGKRIASASDDNTVQVWDVARGQQLLVYKGHTEGIWAVAWSPDGKYLASASEDGTVQVWDALTGKRVQTYKGHSHVVVCLAWSPDGRQLASGSADKQVHIWDLATGRRLFLYQAHTEAVWALAWSPDGTRIASGASDNTARVWMAG